MKLIDIVKCDTQKREFSEKQRGQLAEQGKAMPDGSYPIVTLKDLANAIKSYGRAKEPEEVKAHIIKRARALNAVDKLPPDWNV